MTKSLLILFLCFGCANRSTQSYYYTHLKLSLFCINWYDISTSVIVKATNGPRYVVGCRRQLDKSKLKSGTRVALDMTTLTVMR